MMFEAMLNKDDKEISLTFAKGLLVITAFGGRNRALTIPEIATKIGLNRAVTRRLVRTLEQLGYVTADRNRYELTPRILRLTQGFMEGHGVPQVIQPVLRNTSHAIGESVSFAMLDGDEAIYVAHAFVPTRFTLNMVSVGSRVPLAPTAAGRAMLAFQDNAERDQIMKQLELTAYTEKTKTDRQGFIEMLNTIRLNGFSFAEAEYVEGVSSLAVPVFGMNRRIVGAISIIFPVGEYDEKELNARFLPQLTRCASDIGAAF